MSANNADHKAVRPAAPSILTFAPWFRQFVEPSADLSVINEGVAKFRQSAPMTNRTATLILGTGIGALLAAMLLGPVSSPPGFSLLRHTTSEQAGQQMSGAWIMRAGFVGYGLSVTAAMALARGVLLPVRVALIVFGVGLLATAIWSNLPVVPGLVGDAQEDWLHSAASNVVGVGFAAACAARLFAGRGSPGDALAWIGLAIAVLVPLAMMYSADYRGLFQRLMFLFSAFYIWREVSTASAC